MYHDGEGTEQNHKKAFEWHKKAAEQGHLGAQKRLGCSYLIGEEVEKDYQKAKEWFKKACDLGNYESCKFYEDIEKDYKNKTI